MYTCIRCANKFIFLFLSNSRFYYINYDARDYPIVLFAGSDFPRTFTWMILVFQIKTFKFESLLPRSLPNQFDSRFNSRLFKAGTLKSTTLLARRIAWNRCISERSKTKEKVIRIRPEITIVQKKEIYLPNIQFRKRTWKRDISVNETRYRGMKFVKKKKKKKHGRFEDRSIWG